MIREQKRSVVGHDLLGAGEAEHRVAAGFAYKFNNRHLLDAGDSRASVRWQAQTIHIRSGQTKVSPVRRAAEVLRLHNSLGRLAHQELPDGHGLPEDHGADGCVEAQQDRALVGSFERLTNRNRDSAPVVDRIAVGASPLLDGAVV